MRMLALIGMTVMMVAVVSADDPPPVPNTPAAVDELVYARPFKLAEGYKFEWRKEQPLVTEGYVLVLKVNPALVIPRQSLEPVLYVGDTTAERVSQGDKSGYVVALVPGEIAKLDLAQTPMWFGTPELPERCTADTIALERTKAVAADITAPKAEQVKAALLEGGPILKAQDRYELRRQLARLIQRYSPQEKDLIEGLLVPRNK